MKQEYIDEIKSYYDKAGVFKKNDRYSGEQGTVYTRAGDNAHWLVMEQKGKNGVEVRLTDENGKITTRDNYKVIGNTIKCTGVEKPNGRKRVSLKEKLEEYKAKVNCQSAYGENKLEHSKQGERKL